MFYLCQQFFLSVWLKTWGSEVRAYGDNCDCGRTWVCTDVATSWPMGPDPKSLFPFCVTWGQFWPSGIFVWCVCVRVSVNHKLFRIINHQLFNLVSPNLDQRCKRPWLRSLLFCGAIDHDLQGDIECQNLPHFSFSAQLVATDWSQDFQIWTKNAS